MLINKLPKLLCLKTEDDRRHCDDENRWMDQLNSKLQCIAAATLFFRLLIVFQLAATVTKTWIIALPSKFIIKIKQENSSTLKFIFVIKLFIII